MKHLLKKPLSIFFAILFNVAFAQKPIEKPKETIVEITTNFGVMRARLYNNTPQHRDNFISLVKKGFYDSLLFHRVISGFMIQGGDPSSKKLIVHQF